MKTFVINKDLEECKESRRSRHTTGLDDLIKTIGNKLGRGQYTPIWNQSYYPEEHLQYSFFYMMSRAYSLHHEVIIHPHDLWYMMLCRVAEIVNADSDKYRHIFTNAPEGKKDIIVPSQEGIINVDAVIDELIKVVPVDVNLFIPQFSTLTRNASVACMAAFCDMVKTYYNYMTFCCGIKSVTIAGTVDDWELFKNNFAYIALLLNRADPSNTAWTCQIGLILDSIIESLYTDDPSFYKDIFTQQNFGSGGELNINGWLCDFTSTKRSSKLENFPLMASVIPFKSLTTGKEYVNVYGAFSSWAKEGKIEALYSGFGFEKLAIPEEPKKKALILPGDIGFK